MSSLRFSYWGKAQKAGIINPRSAAGSARRKSRYDQEFQPSTWTISNVWYLDWSLRIRWHVELESLYQGISTKSVLKIWIDSLYPTCSLSQADRLERAIRNIALPVQRIRSSNTKNSDSEYLNREWKPKTTFQPGIITMSCMVINVYRRRSKFASSKLINKYFLRVTHN